ATVVAGVALVGLLAGGMWLLTGDIVLWLQDAAAPGITHAFNERAPRIAAAIVAGGALALSGAIIQAVSRNPLADPGILGVTGGAGLGAVLVVTSVAASTAGMIVAALVGSLLAFALVYLLAWRRGLNADRFILIGIGVSY